MSGDFFFVSFKRTDVNPENRMQAAHHLDEVFKGQKKKKKVHEEHVLAL